MRSHCICVPTAASVKPRLLLCVRVCLNVTLINRFSTAWCRQLALPMGQRYKESHHECALSQASTHLDMTLDVARNAKPQQTNKVCLCCSYISTTLKKMIVGINISKFEWPCFPLVPKLGHFVLCVCFFKSFNGFYTPGCARLFNPDVCCCRYDTSVITSDTRSAMGYYRRGISSGISCCFMNIHTDTVKPL